MLVHPSIYGWMVKVRVADYSGLALPSGPIRLSHPVEAYDSRDAAGGRVRNKLIGVMCLAYMAAAAAGQVPSKPRLAIVRQVDHIIISADTVEDAKALWSLFSEKLK